MTCIQKTYKYAAQSSKENVLFWPAASKNRFGDFQETLRKFKWNKFKITISSNLGKATGPDHS